MSRRLGLLTTSRHLPPGSRARGRCLVGRQAGGIAPWRDLGSAVHGRCCCARCARCLPHRDQGRHAQGCGRRGQACTQRPRGHARSQHALAAVAVCQCTCRAPGAVAAGVRHNGAEGILRGLPMGSGKAGRTWCRVRSPGGCPMPHDAAPPTGTGPPTSRSPARPLSAAGGLCQPPPARSGMPRRRKTVCCNTGFFFVPIFDILLMLCASHRPAAGCTGIPGRTWTG